MRIVVLGPAASAVMALSLVLLGCGNSTGSDTGTDSGTDSGPPFMFDAGPPLTDGLEPTVPAMAGEARAGRIGPGDTAVLIDADAAEGEPGDWIVYNACARFIVQDVRPGDGYAHTPGALIDADIVRPPGVEEVDLLWDFVTLINTRVFNADQVGVLADGSDGGPAIIRAIGADAPMGLIVGAAGLGTQSENLAILQDYILAPDSCTLEVVTTVVATGSHSADIGIGDFVLLAHDKGASFADGIGFREDGLLGSHDYLGASDRWNQQSVLVFAGAGGRLDSPLGDLLAELGGNGMFLYQVDRGPLTLFEYHSVRRYVSVAPDAATATEAMWNIQSIAGLGTVSGTVTDSAGAPVAGARVHLVRIEGGTNDYATWAASGTDGTYSALVPAGDYVCMTTAEGPPYETIGAFTPGFQFPFAEGHEPAAEIPVTVTSGGNVTADPVVGEAGMIDLTVVDGSGNPAPGEIRIAFNGADPSPPRDFLGEASYSGGKKTFWAVLGAVARPLAPGTYDLLASRGFDAEYDERTAVVVLPGGTLTIADLTVVDVVDHAGYLSVDTHLHAAASMDSTVATEDRVGTVMGAGLDILFSTDHDFVWDYTDDLARLGVDADLGFFRGSEMSPIQHHFNTFPVDPVDTRASGGALRWFDELVSTEELSDRMRTELRAEIIQANHGRDSGLFAAAGYDPVTGSIGDTFRWTDDFDAMEIMNGDIDELMADWFSLLNSGRRIVGTGSSDAHGHRNVGEGRTYVGLSEPDPAMLLAGEVGDAFRSGDAIVSGGPFMVVNIDGSPPGSDVDGSAGTVTLNLEVRGPSWIVVDTIRVFANGIEIMSIPVTSPAPPILLTTAIALNPMGDTWYVVRADGATDMGPVYSGRRPFAVSNPIFVDVDGGGFDPPGL